MVRCAWKGSGVAQCDRVEDLRLGVAAFATEARQLGDAERQRRIEHDLLVHPSAPIEA
jgi:hypothetical protein